MKQTDRAVDWSASTAELMPNLRTGDSSPGVADIIDSDRIYLFAAHEDDYLDGRAGTILGDRHGPLVGDSPAQLGHDCPGHAPDAEESYRRRRGSGGTQPSRTRSVVTSEALTLTLPPA